MVTIFTLQSIQSNNWNCRPAIPETYACGSIVYIIKIKIHSSCECIYIYGLDYMIVLRFRDLMSSFFPYRPKYAICGTGIIAQKALFKSAEFGRRLSLALPCPFCTSTRTRTGAEREKREIAKITHVEEEFWRFLLYFLVSTSPV